MRDRILSMMIVIMSIMAAGMTAFSLAAVGGYRGAHSSAAATDTAWENARASYNAKLAKSLRFEQGIAQLDVNYWHRQLRPYAMSDHPPAALLDSLGQARVRLDLATRALNRFMQP